MAKLIPMTDFILKRASKDISKYTIMDAFKNGAKAMNEIFSYTQFLKMRLNYKMFDKTNPNMLFIGGFNFKSQADFEQWVGDNFLSDIESLIGLEIELKDEKAKEFKLI